MRFSDFSLALLRVAPLSLAVILGCCALLHSSPARSEDGLDWMRKVDTALSSSGEELSVRMTLNSASGRSEQRSFRMWIGSAQGGKGSRSLIRFESPASIAGTALLSVQRKQGGQDNWLYLPGLSQVRRVAAADRKQAFVQSEFTIEDLSVAMNAERRVYKVLGEVQWNERACVQLEDSPKDAAAAKESGYGRVVLYIDKELHVVHRVDFYDHAGGLLKVLRAQGLVQVGQKWRFDVATMANLQTGANTIMQVTGRGTGKVDDSIFSPAGLDAW